MSNTNLTAAKKAKNDEFYTQMSDIEKELQHYEQHFAGKVVYCNCDDPRWSNFWRYFHENFARLKLKKLTASHYHPKEPVFSMTYTGGNDADYNIGTITPLQQNGDFRSPECIELLKEADIVVTNPPFSIARSNYLPQLMEYEKKFIIIGDLNWVTYKSIFPLIKDNKIWMGYNNIKQFLQPDGTMAKFGNKLWYTNLDIPKRHEPIDLIEHYTPERYPKYDNYDAINVDKTLDIPCDYEPCWYKCPHAESCAYARSEGKTDEALCEQACNGEMGVPISYLDKHCSDQFEIVANGGSYKGEDSVASELYVAEGLYNAPTHTHQTQSIQENHYPQEESATELLECQSASLINTARNSLQSLDSLPEISEDFLDSPQKPIGMAHTLTGHSSTEGFLFKKCNGIMGVPISFLDKYCSDQFKILGIANGCGDYDDKPLKRYKNAKQHAMKSGEWVVTNGSKANTRACIRIITPNDVYYTADNINYNIESLYARILIHRRKENNNENQTSENPG